MSKSKNRSKRKDFYPPYADRTTEGSATAYLWKADGLFHVVGFVGREARPVFAEKVPLESLRDGLVRGFFADQRVRQETIGEPEGVGPVTVDRGVDWFMPDGRKRRGDTFALMHKRGTLSREQLEAVVEILTVYEFTYTKYLGVKTSNPERVGGRAASPTTNAYFLTHEPLLRAWRAKHQHALTGFAVDRVLIEGLTIDSAARLRCIRRSRLRDALLEAVDDWLVVTGKRIPQKVVDSRDALRDVDGVLEKS